MSDVAAEVISLSINYSTGYTFMRMRIPSRYLVVRGPLSVNDRLRKMNRVPGTFLVRCYANDCNRIDNQLFAIDCKAFGKKKILLQSSAYLLLCLKLHRLSH